MSVLFENIVFGPVKSRRLGVSLGINLLPVHGKLCNFDCIYCECGFNKDRRGDRVLPSVKDVAVALESRLKENMESDQTINTITFSGNGEPTMHPDFAGIVDVSLDLRDKYARGAVVSVLTNGSRIGNPKIAEALLKVDNAIIKIDSAFDETVRVIDRPLYRYSVREVEKNLQPFEEKFVLQTMFLTGITEEGIIDNTTEKEIVAWYEMIDRIKPREIMIYTIDRETPLKGLEKVSVPRMEEIAKPLKDKGYKLSISG